MKKGKRVTESKSEQEQIIDLKNRIAFLEREISQKQILIEFQD